VRAGDWRAAKVSFRVAYFLTLGQHPVYYHYWLVDRNPLGGQREDADTWRHVLELNSGDPYYYQLVADTFPWDRYQLVDRRLRLDPQQMIVGGEEFPRPAKPDIPGPAAHPNWEAADEGSLLAMGMGWSDSWPVEAQQAFRLALKKDPRFVQAYSTYVEFLVAHEKWDDIITDLTPALTVQGKPPQDAAIIYDALAKAYLAKGDAAQAQRFTKAAAESRDRMITRHSQVIRLMFHIPTLPREGFNDN
jgi:hypothetical protein